MQSLFFCRIFPFEVINEIANKTVHKLRRCLGLYGGSSFQGAAALRRSLCLLHFTGETFIENRRKGAQQ